MCMRAILDHGRASGTAVAISVPVSGWDRLGNRGLVVREAGRQGCVYKNGYRGGTMEEPSVIWRSPVRRLWSTVQATEAGVSDPRRDPLQDTPGFTDWQRR